MSELDDLIARFAPSAPAFIADPYPVLSALREATPIFRNEPTGQWMVTRFDDAERLLRSPSLGRNHLHRYTHEQVGRAGPDPRWERFHEHERWSLLSLEPPDHTRIRRLVASVFTPRAVARLGPEIGRRVDRLLEHCRDLGTFDLLTDFAQPYSVGVICGLLGVPESDASMLLDWSHAIVKMYEVEAANGVRREADDAAGEFLDYTMELIDLRRRADDGRLVSALARAESDGELLTDAEIASTTMVLLEAGHEATVNTLGNGLRALLRHPEQWRRLTGGEVGPEVAVEEMVRWDSPLQLFARYVLEPGVEVDGTEFAVGDEVAMLFGSAQRDPRRFSDPDTFDIGRGDGSHIGFGAGLHFCVGAALARTELTHAVDGLIRWMPDLELVEEPVYHPTFVIRGLAGLRLRTC